MRQQRKDAILTAAFDGLKGADGLTKEEQADVKFLTEMKGALLELKRVPECQMSSERLKDAILNKGVKRTSPWGLTALGGAAACGIFTLMLLNQYRAQEGAGVVTKGDSMKSDNISTVTVDPPALIDQPNAEKFAVVTQDNRATEPLSERLKPLLNPRRETQLKSVALRHSVKQEDKAEVMLESATWDLETDSVDRAVVVVDSGFVTESGAARAVELEAYGDVVFGG